MGINPNGRDDGRVQTVVSLYPATLAKVDEYVRATAMFGAHYTRESAMAATIQDWARDR